MERLLIGSQAMRIHFPDSRQPNDTDYFSRLHVEGAESFWHPALSTWPHDGIATPDELYTIKVSHAFWDLHGTWGKHMHDIGFLKSKGAQFIPELYDILYPIWNDKHGAKRARLNVAADEFFTTKVTRIYDHDSIHESIAYGNEPMFKNILREGEQVAVDKSKFDALSYEDKLRLVREEVYATALERILIPTNFGRGWKSAYAQSLKQTIISYSKGWFPLFIVLNYTELKEPDINYVERHKNNLDKLRSL